MARLSFREVVARLESHYGRPEAPVVTGAWELILWENIAYLADDARRLEAFRALKRRVGLSPKKIVEAPDDALLEATQRGILAPLGAQKLRNCAEIVLREFNGDVRPVLKQPLPAAKRALRKFPSIGEPAAEKILLFTESYPVLALESNGLRVLVRLGFGEEKKSYSTTYRLVQRAVADELKTHCRWLIGVHQVLRQHGQELCKRSAPLCSECPLKAECAFYRAGGDRN